MGDHGRHERATPFAGQGMNSGIRDAHNLSWKIAAVVSGHLGERLLDTYEAERRRHAAEMIEKAGFKGTTVGGARVSDRHANFIINEGHATAEDVRNLIGRIQKKVQEQFAVRLEPEVKLAGEW